MNEERDVVTDIVAAAMVALIERGAPRDFVHLFDLIRCEQTTRNDCWAIWQQQQKGGMTLEDARKTVIYNIEAVARCVSLDGASEAERDHAAARRCFFRSEWFVARDIPQTGIPVIDGSVYPDTDPPTAFSRMEEQADYVHRISCAWDFGVIPDDDTFALFAGWKDVFDALPVSNSIGYHAFRSWYFWPPFQGHCLVTPRYVEIDRRDGVVDDTIT